MIRLAYSANAYMRFPVEEAIRRIAALGYAGIELMADVPHAWPGDVTDHDIEAIRAALARHGLVASNMNAFMMNKIGDPRQPYWYPSWIEPDRAYRQVRIDHTIRSLTLASRLGVPHISTEPGGPITGEGHRESAMATFVEMLRPVLDHAAAVGVKLLIEPEPGLLIETADQFLELTARIDSPMLGLNFDVGHFYCVGEPLPETVRRMKGWTRHYHIEDIAATRVHEHLIPGRGAIDLSAVVKAIHATGYDGWITVELYPYLDDPDAAGREALDFLVPLMPQ